MWLRKLLFSFLIVFVVLTIPISYGVTYHLPKNTVIPDGLKVHFGDYWVNTTGTDMTITAWFINGWMNYTVNSAGTQEIHNGTKPSSVYIDGVNKTENDGWTYSGGTVTVTAATYSTAVLTLTTTEVGDPFFANVIQLLKQNIYAVIGLMGVIGFILIGAMVIALGDAKIVVPAVTVMVLLTLGGAVMLYVLSMV